MDTKWWAPAEESFCGKSASRTSGIVYSHNGKRGLVGNVRIVTESRLKMALKVKEQAATARLVASEFKEVQSIVIKDV
jgi:hypothetical protein